MRRITTAIIAASPSVIQTPSGKGNNCVGSFNSMMLFTGVSGKLIVWLSDNHFAAPRATPIMPSVTMNGIIRNQPIATPFTNPSRPPARIVKATATVGG